jgi:NTE family protein
VSERTARERTAEEYLPRPAARRDGIALCLSGGGYRAALFHLGVLRRLDELGTLSRVDTVSAVSGGSILAGYMAQHVGDWPVRQGPIPGFAEKVVPGFREFTRKNIRTLWAFQRALPWRWPDATVAVDSLADRYEKDVIQLRLGQLPRRPNYVFCATELTFGTNWVAERERVGSYMPGYVEPPPDWPAARAVAASSCFPPVFEPMPVGLDPALFGGGRLADDAPDREKLVGDMRLTDGGVYDNMALEPVWKSHAVLLVSDGGATFDRKGPAPLWRPFKQLGRYLEVQSRQAGAVRRRWMIASFLTGEMSGVYLGIGSRVTSFDPGAPGYEADLVDEVIAEVRTDLDFFSDAEAAVLQNHGYLLADAAMRAYGQSWSTPAPLRIPYPEWMDPGRVRAALRKSAKRTPVVGRWRAVAGAGDAVKRGWGRVSGVLGRRRR